ncbi:MAG: lipocalin-like domain-containing protein [Bacteroidaceae bacterium]|nr:lipocalin-like domain-containing protein [Bacteroidaceae bacterium]
MMNKIAIILMCIVALSACDKVYINGELDGMWKLQQVDDGENVYHPTDIFYSFQRHMTQISRHYEEKLPLRYLGNLYYCGDTVCMSGFRKYLEEDIIASDEVLNSFYLYKDSTKFIVETLNDETLIMRSDDKRYTLRRW